MATKSKFTKIIKDAESFLNKKPPFPFKPTDDSPVEDKSSNSPNTYPHNSQSKFNFNNVGPTNTVLTMSSSPLVTSGMSNINTSHTININPDEVLANKIELLLKHVIRLGIALDRIEKKQSYFEEKFASTYEKTK